MIYKFFEKALRKISTLNIRLMWERVKYSQKETCVRRVIFARK